MQLYLVVPEGEPWGSYNTERSRSAAVTPEEAAVDMARRDFQEFGSREDAYDVYVHQKLPRLIGTYTSPPAEECRLNIIMPTGKKPCGCGDESCTHGASPKKTWRVTCVVHPEQYEVLLVTAETCVRDVREDGGCSAVIADGVHIDTQECVTGVEEVIAH